MATSVLVNVDGVRQVWFKTNSTDSNSQWCYVSFANIGMPWYISNEQMLSMLGDVRDKEIVLNATSSDGNITPYLMAVRNMFNYADNTVLSKFLNALGLTFEIALIIIFLIGIYRFYRLFRNKKS